MGVVKNSHVMIWSHETIQFNNGHGEKKKGNEAIACHIS